MDSAKVDIEDSFAKLPSLPPLPETPDFPSLDFPGSVSWLSCPLAQCIGFPKLPSVDFSGGLPDLGGASEELVGNVKEYLDAFDGLGGAFASTIGKSARITAKNGLKALKNAPQSILNDAVDVLTFGIAELAEGAFLGQVDSILSCMVKADPSFDQHPKVKQYRELRTKYSDENGGPADLAKLDLADGPLGEIKSFQKELTTLDNKVKETSNVVEGAANYNLDDSIGSIYT